MNQYNIFFLDGGTLLIEAYGYRLHNHVAVFDTGHHSVIEVPGVLRVECLGVAE